MKMLAGALGLLALFVAPADAQYVLACTRGGFASIYQDNRNPIPCTSTTLADKWWEKCLPWRRDCVHSDTAIIGWSSGGATRGPGFCYTEQYFTCKAHPTVWETVLFGNPGGFPH